MDHDNKFSAAESLALIEGMINKAKNNFSDDSLLYLLWGWVVFFCSITHFVLLKLALVKTPEMVWMLTWAAVAIQIIYLKRQKKIERVKTYADEIISFLWLSFGISMFIITFIFARLNAWVAMFPVCLLLYGFPTFLTGIIMKFSPLKIGGIVCWILSVASTFMQPVYGLLLLATSMLVAWIIPGYLLKARFKKQSI